MLLLATYMPCTRTAACGDTAVVDSGPRSIGYSGLAAQREALRPSEAPIPVGIGEISTN